MSTATLARTITATPAARAWQAITTGAQRGPWARRGSVADWTAYAVTGPGRVSAAGEVWRDRAGEWFANRTGYGVHPVGHATRADALASVGWLDTITADALTDWLHTEGGTVAVVLSDGTTAHAYAAERLTVSAFAGVGRPAVARPAVELTVTVDGTASDMARRWPVSFDALRVRPWSLVDDTGANRERIPAYRLTFRAHAPLALTPPCLACEAPAGAACWIYCRAAV